MHGRGVRGEFRMLRHTYLTRLYNVERDLRFVQDQAGLFFDGIANELHGLRVEGRLPRQKVERAATDGMTVRPDGFGSTFDKESLHDSICGV